MHRIYIIKYIQYKNKYLNIKKSFLYLGGAAQDSKNLFTKADIILFRVFNKKFWII